MRQEVLKGERLEEMPSSQLGWGSVCLRAEECSEHILQLLSFPSLRVWKDFCNIISLRNWWGSFRQNPLWCRDPLKLQSSRVSHSQATVHPDSSKSPKRPLKCSYQCMAPEASTPGEQILIWLSRFWSGLLPCKLSSLISPRRVVDFQIVQLVLVRLGVSVSKPFTCWSWNQKSISPIFPVDFIIIIPILQMRKIKPRLSSS